MVKKTNMSFAKENFSLKETFIISNNCDEDSIESPIPSNIKPEKSNCWKITVFTLGAFLLLIITIYFLFFYKN